MVSVRASALLLVALAALAATHAASASGHQQAPPMVMQLHRLPKREVHPETYRRRRLAQHVTESGEDDAASPMEAVPLHIGLGTHYTWVYAGSPPQRASVIVDTGSGILAFPCTGCDGCGDHTDKQFNASASSTLVHVTCAAHDYFKCQGCQLETSTCAISQSYMEGSSWDATVVEDVVFLGGDNSAANVDARNRFGTHFKFGCQHAETGLFIEQVADGIMGLSNTDNHIVAKLHQENKIPNKLFALCFAENGGAMTIGAPDSTRHRGDIHYAKLIGDRSSGNFYNVRITDILIGNQSIEADSTAFTRGRFIVDSGTTDSYLPRAVKNQFMDVFKAVSGLEYKVSSSSCKGFKEEEIDKLPLIQFILESDDGGSMTLDISPSQYLIQGDNSFCGGIFLSEHSGGVIGANLMMNRDVIFDGSGQRVGFVDADCSYTAGDDAVVVSSGAPASTPKSSRPAATSTSAPEEETVPVATAATTTAPSSSHPPTTAEVPAETTATAAVATTEAPAATTSAPITNTIATSSTTTTTVETSASEASEESEKPIATTSTIAKTIESSANETLTTNTEQGTGSGSLDTDAHPMVLTIVGTVLAVAFLLIFIASVRHKKNRKKAQNWSRVNEDEDDEDAELGLVGAKGPSKRATASGGKPKHQPLAATADDEDDSDESDSDDEDEIFDRQTQEQASKHDSHTLEQL